MEIKVPSVIASRVPVLAQLAMAINLNITVTVGPETLEWEIETDQPNIPRDQTNLVVAVAEAAAPAIVPHQLTIKSTLPNGVGLGSSNAAVVAGIKLAANLAASDASPAQQVAFAHEYEPNDLATQTILAGGTFVAATEGKTPIKLPAPPVQLFCYLPTNFGEAAVVDHPAPADPTVFAALIQAIQTNDRAWFHARLPLASLKNQVTAAYFPQAEMVARAVQTSGGYGCFVAGNGPALICLVPPENKTFAQHFKHTLSGGDLYRLQVDQQGTVVIA